MLQGAFDVLLAYTGVRVVGGKPIRDHLSTAMFLGEMVAAISVGIATFLELCHQFDHPEIYGSWTTDAMVGKARSKEDLWSTESSASSTLSCNL